VVKIVTRAIILDKNRKVLLGKRASGKGNGQWALVGGKPEGKESLTETIIREVNEELGIKFIKPVLWKETNSVFAPIEEWRVFYFYGTYEGKIKLDLDEISEANFFGKEDLVNLNIVFNHKAIISQFFKEVYTSLV